MRELVVDLSDLDTKEKIHDFFSEALETPKWYGRNMDALYDELTSISLQTVIRCQGTDAELSVCTKALMNVLQDAADANQYLTVEMV